MSDKSFTGGQNSKENIEHRKRYRAYYNSQSEDVRKKLPSPEGDDDVSGMDGNWVFQIDEGRMTSGDEMFISKQEDLMPEDESKPPMRMYNEDEVQEVVRRVVMAMQMSEHPEVLFQARCILIAFGIGDPPTETELSRGKDCSRQFVSKKVKRIQQLFNLSPSQFMRSEQACKAYAKAYWKKNKKGKVNE